MTILPCCAVLCCAVLQPLLLTAGAAHAVHGTPPPVAAGAGSAQAGAVFAVRVGTCGALALRRGVVTCSGRGDASVWRWALSAAPVCSAVVPPQQLHPHLCPPKQQFRIAIWLTRRPVLACGASHAEPRPALCAKGGVISIAGDAPVAMFGSYVARHACAAAGQAVAGPALQALAAVWRAALAPRRVRRFLVFLALCARVGC